MLRIFWGLKPTQQIDIMVVYACKRCGHETSQKCNLAAHLSKKSPCQTTLSSAPREGLLAELEARDESDMPHACPRCAKRFTHRSSMCRHQKICSGVTACVAYDHLNELPKPALEPVIRVPAPAPTPAPAPISPPPASTPKILPFGKENKDFLDDQDLLTKCLRRTDKGVLEYIQCKHFHPDHPENRNVKVTNLKLPYVKVFNGKKWLVLPKDDVLADLVSSSCDDLEYHYDFIKDDIRSIMKNHRSFIRNIEAFIKTLEDDDRRDRLYAQLAAKTFLLLYNNTDNAVV